MSQVTPPHFLTPIEPLLLDYVNRAGKFGKSQSLYLPKGVNPPPVAFIYQCQSCRYFQKPSRCKIVSEVSPPDPNSIEPLAWCVWWSNLDSDLPFDWLRRRMVGEPDPWE